MTSERRQVIVIGAGISGLVCAHRLKALGIDVLLLESSNRVGGVIHSERIDGFLIERGPNSSQGTAELMELIEELGIMSDLAEGDPKAPAYVYFDGRLHRVPSSPPTFLKSRLLSFAGKLRIFREPFVGPRRSEAEESVAAFARRRIGKQAAERMVAPFVSGIYAGDAEQISVQAAFPKLANLEDRYGGLIRGTIAKAREAKQARKSAAAVLDKASPATRRMISFRDGMGFLPETLAASMGEDLMLGCSDIVLRTTDGATLPRSPFQIGFSRGGDEVQIECNRVILALPAGAAARLLAGVSTELNQLLAGIEYAPLAVVSLAYAIDSIRTELDGFGFLVAPSEGLRILGCVWNSSLFENRAPRGQALLTVFVGGARNPAIVHHGDAELVTAVHAELQKVLGVSSEPRVIAITRYDRSIPQYNLGHAGRVQRIETLLEGLQGLAITGNYLHGVSTGDCVKSGEETARRCAAALQEQDGARAGGHEA